MSRHARRRVRLTFDIPTASELGWPLHLAAIATGVFLLIAVLLVALG